MSDPLLIASAGPCVYCGRETRMYDGASFSNVDDGELHSCWFSSTYSGPHYEYGDFVQSTVPDEPAQ
jgi:hypothetical protein